MDFPDDFPQKNKRRAYRKDRFKKARKHAKEVGKTVLRLKEDYLEYFVCRAADNLKKCSCWMCRNPRRVFKGKEKLTMQERRLAVSKEE